MKRIFAYTAVLAIATGLSAGAVTITTTSGTTSSVAGITSTITFDCAGGVACTTDPAGHATYSGTITFDQGTNPGGGGHWLTDNGASTTIAFNMPINYFGLLWGSPDTFNSLTLFNGATQVGSTITGTNVNASIGNYVNVFAGTGEQFTSAVLSSSSCCFETDNHSYRLLASQAVPEPVLFFPMALAAVGFAAYRRLR